MNPVYSQGYNPPSFVLVDPNMIYYNSFNQPCIIPFSNSSLNANANFENMRDQDQLKSPPGNKKTHKSENPGQEGNNLTSANKNIYPFTKNPGRWSTIEHQKFIKGSIYQGLIHYGKNWPKIEQMVGNRTSSQIRSHAQKFFYKLQKKFGDEDPLQIVRSQKLNEIYPKILNQIDDSENSQIWELSSSKQKGKNKSNMQNSQLNKSYFRRNQNDDHEISIYYQENMINF